MRALSESRSLLSIEALRHWHEESLTSESSHSTNRTTFSSDYELSTFPSPSLKQNHPMPHCPPPRKNLRCPEKLPQPSAFFGTALLSGTLVKASQKSLERSAPSRKTRLSGKIRSPEKPLEKSPTRTALAATAVSDDQSASVATVTILADSAGVAAAATTELDPDDPHTLVIILTTGRVSATIEAHSNESVEALKRRIHHKFDIRVSEQELLFSEDPLHTPLSHLQDRSTLTSCRMVNGAVLHLHHAAGREATASLLLAPSCPDIEGSYPR